MKSEIAYKFSEDNVIKINAWKKKFPNEHAKSSIIYVLHICQKEKGFITEEHMKATAEILGIDFIDVYEIATFYTMYNLAPVGKYFLQVCTTSPCLLRGAGQIVKSCQNKISKNQNEISENGMCSWTEVECLGACVNAPMMQVNNSYYEDLNKESTDKIIDSFLEDKPVNPGSSRNRNSSAPENNKINGANNA